MQLLASYRIENKRSTENQNVEIYRSNILVNHPNFPTKNNRGFGGKQSQQCNRTTFTKRNGGKKENCILWYQLYIVPIETGGKGTLLVTHGNENEYSSIIVHYENL